MRFPARLDMSEFTSRVLSAVHDSHGKDHTELGGPDEMYEYDLYAVVDHNGQLDRGHYTCFARYQDEVSPVVFLVWSALWG